MCGIAGIVGIGMEASKARATIEKMKDAQAHRGPDGEGTFLDPDGKPVFFGHRRLAIFDPDHSHQPMSSADGALTIVFNGAIYNYLELRQELIALGHPIKTVSDVEVLVYAYAEWGEACVTRLNGMFAFAIWDIRNSTVFCARDRIGIKPYYYCAVGDGVVFSSEIKALLASGLVAPEPDPEGVQDYVTFQFCLDNKTMFKNVRQLPPGCTLTIDVGNGAKNPKISRYWELDYAVDTAHDESDFVDWLAALLEDAVRLQLRSDVPLGAHLSGGLDSSAIVGFASRLRGAGRLDCFTGAFREGPEFDETGYARIAAGDAGAAHHEIFVAGAEFADLMPRLIYHMDEPAAGPGVYPQYHVSRLAADHVKVVLGGQGGDEIFLGYARYLIAYLEQCVAGAIHETMEESRYAVTLDSISTSLPVLRDYLPMLRRCFGRGLKGETSDAYLTLVDRGHTLRQLIHADAFDGTYSCEAAFRDSFERNGLASLVNRMTDFDIRTSLPALLQVEDRTSMAVGLESRVPLLDHRILELMASVPPNIKFKDGRLKHLFLLAVRDVVPDAVWERTDKKGFPTPFGHWIKGVARDFVGDTLLSPQARERGLYRTDLIETAITEEGEYGRSIWGLLCLELWYRTFMDGSRAAAA